MQLQPQVNPTAVKFSIVCSMLLHVLDPGGGGGGGSRGLVAPPPPPPPTQKINLKTELNYCILRVNPCISYVNISGHNEPQNFSTIRFS